MKTQKCIVVNSCNTCPLINTCEVFNSLKPNTRLAIKLSPAYNNIILDNCPLQDYDI